MSIQIDNWVFEMTGAELEPQRLERKRTMDTLALATEPELAGAWEALAVKPAVKPVRGPETGLVMVRGRTGGTGQPFNLGEVAVCRATVMLEDGTAGHAHVLGSHPQKARLAAVFDALAQTDSHKPAVEALLQHIASRISGERRRKTQETAATRVDFFTMVRGED